MKKGESTKRGSADPASHRKTRPQSATPTEQHAKRPQATSVAGQKNVPKRMGPRARAPPHEKPTQAAPSAPGSTRRCAAAAREPWGSAAPAAAPKRLQAVIALLCIVRASDTADFDSPILWGVVGPRPPIVVTAAIVFA